MTGDNSFELLDFHRLLQNIAGYSRSEASHKSILTIEPSGSREDIEKRFELVKEITRLAEDGDPLRLSEFSDITGLLETVMPEGAVLDASELAEFVPVLRIGLSVLDQVNARDDLPSLRRLTGHLSGHPELIGKLELSIDEEGNILDGASFLLSDLRRQIRGVENRIRKKLEEMVRNEKTVVFMQDDFITKRAGRWVIPVRMDSKGMVDGVVHDVSKSGETAFIEPLAIIALANKLENLVAGRKAEEIRILKALCDDIRNIADDISSEFRALVYLDTIDSISRFAADLEMKIPLLNDTGRVEIKAGRHPLLTIALGKAGDNGGVVPLDVSLGGEKRVMVITGPNAGGKTVAIKTVGLIILMAMSGIPIPADSSSSIPVIRKILVDMGDEQSLEENLSTFSAHISNISRILQKAEADTLVLIDELGTGTDPEEGAAIACAVLNGVKKRGALVFATTHLMGIKGYVQNTCGMINASMDFDNDTLSPLYRLRIGLPGRSHAIEIARKFGLRDDVINNAKELIGTGNIEFDNLLSDFVRKRAEYEERLGKLEQLQRELQEIEIQLNERVAETDEKHREIMEKTYEDAVGIISDTKRKMYAYIEDLKIKNREETKKSLKEVTTIQMEMSREVERYRKEDGEKLEADSINIGDTVFIESLSYDASVVGKDERRNRIKVRAGDMEVEVPASDVRPQRGISLDAGSGEKPAGNMAETVSSRINLVGSRADEAVARLDRFLNHAVLGGLNDVLVIHGIGQGILMKVIREYLTENPLVKRWRSGESSEGGTGVTAVTLE
ncbi:MAG TPA: endonuclease MutS2 [Nitrospirae bacterium]|nr:endonuclease MutS2 [Nitrospirota bacterium]